MPGGEANWWAPQPCSATDFYKSYMRGRKTFDQSNLLGAVPTAALPDWNLDIPDLADYYHWFLHHIGHQPAVPQPA